MNQVKDTPKTQVQDTLSHLAIIYNIPDSNNILTIDFHATMTPPWQKNYRIDWNFGDSTGIISKFDTSNLTHYYQKFGSYSVTLSGYDTLLKTILGKTKGMLDIENNAIDTNFLHKFTKIKILFSGILKFNSDTVGRQDSIIPTNQLPSDSKPITVQWNGFAFQFSRHDSTHYYVPDCGMGIKGVIIDYKYSQNISGILSPNGRSIDTLSDNFSDYSYKNELHIQENRNDLQSIAANSIPLFSATQDVIIFSYSGASLKNMITALRSESNSSATFIYHTILQGVSWDMGNPTLTITFSK